MEYFCTDGVDVDTGSIRMTRDGYLVARAKIARSGIQIYDARGFGITDKQIVRVYRPPEEVFDEQAMGSLAHRPVTIEHPTEFVDSKNWRALAVGDTGGKIIRDGDFVVTDLTLMDQAAIESYQSGKRQLSVGYHCNVEFTPGKTADGEEYDAIQRAIRGNHLALVDQARAGPECRIGDRGPAQPTKENPMTTVRKTVDGFTFDATEQACQAIDKLEAKVAAGDAALKERDAKIGTLETTVADARKQVETKDGEIAALKVAHKDELEKLKKELEESEEELDARAEERQGVIEDAAIVAGKAVDGKGKKTAAIRREAVTIALGDAATKDKSDDFITGSFNTLLAQRSDGAQRQLGDAMRANLAGKPIATADEAYEARKASLGTAWQNQTAK